MALVVQPISPSISSIPTLSKLLRSSALSPIAIRQAAAPAANASPPTVTYSSTYFGAGGSTSSIFGKVVVPLFIDTVGTLNTSAFRFYGWTPTQRSTSSSIGQPQNGSFASAKAYSGGNYVNGYEFEYYGSLLELIFFADTGGYGFQIWIDGSPLMPTAAGNIVAQGNGAASTGGIGANYNTVLTWPSAGWHTVLIRCARGCGFGGVVIAPQDVLQPSSNKSGPQILILADSYGDGNGAGNGYPNTNYALDLYPHILSFVLGIKDIWLDAQGGTGLTNNGSSSNKDTYQNRLVNAISVFKNGALPQWQRLNPDIVLIQGSTNDGSATAASITAAANLAIATARAAWPNAYVILTSPMLPNGFQVSWTSGNKTNYYALCAAAPNADLFIDAVTGTYVAFSGGLPTGSSYAGSLTFTGPLVGATSGTLVSAFTGVTGSTYSILFSDGTFSSGVTLTNGSTAVTWTTPTTNASATVSYVNQTAAAWFTGNGSYGSPYSGLLTFTAALSAATSATLATAFVGPTSSGYSIKFSDGTIKTGLTLTNNSTAVSWSGAVTASATAAYTNTATGSPGNADIMVGNSPHGTAAWHLTVGTLIARFILRVLGL